MTQTITAYPVGAPEIRRTNESTRFVGAVCISFRNIRSGDVKKILSTERFWFYLDFEQRERSFSLWELGEKEVAIWKFYEDVHKATGLALRIANTKRRFVSELSIEPRLWRTESESVQCIYDILRTKKDKVALDELTFREGSSDPAILEFQPHVAIRLEEQFRKLNPFKLLSWEICCKLHNEMNGWYRSGVRRNKWRYFLKKNRSHHFNRANVYAASLRNSPENWEITQGIYSCFISGCTNLIFFKHFFFAFGIFTHWNEKCSMSKFIIHSFAAKIFPTQLIQTFPC